MRSVGDLTESDLIARIQAQLPPAPPWLVVGIGDDAAVIEPERNRLEVLSVDTLVESVHFDRGFVPADAIGHRALAVNLSDLAAMGAAPRLALLAMALPPALALADFDAIVSGFCGLAARHRLHVAGGNLTRTPGPLTIDVTVAGTVKRRQALTRAGARPGDELYVSGTIGSAKAGLTLLRERHAVVSHQSSGVSPQSSGVSPQSSGVSPQSSGSSLSRQADVSPTDASRLTTDDRGLMTDASRLTTDDRGLTTDASRLTTDDRRLTTAYLRPEPRVRLGVWLARNRVASACIDLSDGLADGVHRIAEASGVGITVDASALPIDDSARAAFSARGADVMRETVAGGDDYELLFTVGRRKSRAILAAAQHTGVPLTRIGVCTVDRAVLVEHAGSKIPLPSVGFSHFAAGRTMASSDR